MVKQTSSLFMFTFLSLPFRGIDLLCQTHYHLSIAITIVKGKNNEVQRSHDLL